MKYHHIQIKTNSSKKPDVFVGTALRGTFGHILKEYVCVEPSFECDGCSYQKECLSYLFYPTQDDKYRSYRIDARIEPKNYDFSIYLFGDHARYIRTIVQVLYRMMRSGRLTSSKLTFSDSKIYHNNNEMHFDKYGTLKPFKANSQMILPNKTSTHDVRIKLLTPLFIKEKKQYKKNITLEDILMSIFKRNYFFEYNKMVFNMTHTPSYVSVSTILYERDNKQGSRYSNKQKKQIPIEGMLGEITVKGLDSDSYNLLKWGEILGVGKGTALGQGAIQIE